MPESIASEVLSASLGGAISASVLYPLEVLKTKMQAETSSDDQDDDSNDKEELIDEKESTDEDEEDGAVKVRAASAASSSSCTTAKTSNVKGEEGEKDSTTKKKKVATTGSSNKQNLSMVEYATELYNKEGYEVFLKGMSPSAFQSACEKSLYFFAYTGLKEMHHQTFGSSSGNIRTLDNLILGYLADWCHLPFTLPLDCWTTQIQCQSQVADGQQKSSLELLLVLLNKGPNTWYKGIQAYYVLCLKPAIQYTVFEQVKAIVLKRKQLKQQQKYGNRHQSAATTLSAAEAFLLGMFARAIATVLTYPYLRAKVIMQTANKAAAKENGDDGSTEKSNSVLMLLMKMYAKDGITSCFQGIGPEITRGVFSAALMLMIKEKIHNFVAHQLIRN